MNPLAILTIISELRVIVDIKDEEIKKLKSDNAELLKRLLSSEKSEAIKER